MLRLTKINICAGLLAISVLATSKAGIVRNAASLSFADVSAAILSAQTGDAVLLPAGSATWDSPLIITKCITISGRGIDITIIKGNITDANNGVISFRPDSAAIAADQLFRVTGFTLDADSKSNGILVHNSSSTPVTKVRIDNNRILNAGGVSAGRAVYIQGSVYGVADHNVIENFSHGMDSEGINSLQWNNLPIELGTAKNFYFEDNILTCLNSNVFHAGGHGGRYVARYNEYKNLSTASIFPVFDMHGNQPPDITALMVAEVYGNNVDLGTKGGRIIDQRGGTLLAFYNNIKWGTDGANIVIREENLDSNYPPGNSYIMHVTGSYYWNNRQNNNLVSEYIVTSNQIEDTYDLAQNIDFWLQNPSYNGSTQIGIYVGSTLPANCTVGDGAWITTQSVNDLTGLVGRNPATPISGTFYKCTSPNIWTQFYTPYTYPHPLTLIPPWPPSNLKVN